MDSATVRNGGPVPNKDDNDNTVPVSRSEGSSPRTDGSDNGTVGGDSQNPPNVEAVPKNFGPYRILEMIGRGGQGVVFAAEDTRLGRRVALKIQRDSGFISNDVMARFRLEGEITSRLDHPGICTVYDVGYIDGMAYIAMRFVDGSTLSAMIVERKSRIARGTPANLGTATPPSESKSTNRSEIRRFVAIIAKAARALHAAHEVGVIHRDIKPGNIMIADGDAPVILDFGLARDESRDDVALTRTGDFFGTPAYMSPEQLTGGTVRLDRRTDVFSLGATLYECLTLEKPFEAPTHEGLYTAIRTKEPRDPRQLEPAISRDLKIVIETALAKNLARRYQSAAAFADDLEGYLEHRPIAARPAGPIEKTIRWARREPMKAALVVILAIVAPTLAALITRDVMTRDEREAAERAAIERRKDTLLAAAFHDLGDGGAPERAVEKFRAALAMPGGSIEAIAGIAMAEIKSGRPQVALDILDERSDSTHGRRAFAMLRSQALSKLNRADDAAAAARDVPPPKSALDHFLDGARYLDTGHNGEAAAFAVARDSFRRAVLKSPVPRTLFFGEYIHALAHTRDKSLVEETIGAARELFEDSPNLLAAYGRAYFIVEDNDAARRVFSAALAMNSESAEALSGLGEVESMVGNHEKAVVLLEKATAIVPDDWSLHALRTRCLARAGKVDDALRSMNVTLAMKKYADVRRIVARAFYDQGRFAEAVKLHQDAVKVVHYTPNEWFDFARSLRAVKDHRGAEDAYLKAIEIDPKHHFSWYGLGTLKCDETNDPKGAVEALTTYTELRPENFSGWDALSKALGQLGRHDEALKASERALAIDPTARRGRHGILRCLLALERSSEITAYGRRFVDSDPTDAVAWDVLASSLLMRKEYAAAYGTLIEAMKACPEDPHIRIKMSICCAEVGRFEEAIAATKKATALLPTDPLFWSQLGHVERLGGNFEAAAAAFRKAGAIATSDDARRQFSAWVVDAESWIPEKEALQRAIDGSALPDDVPRLLRFGSLIGAMKKPAATRRCYAAAIEKLPATRSVERADTLIVAGRTVLECREPMTVDAASAPLDLGLLPLESRTIGRAWIKEAVDILESLLDDDALHPQVVTQKMRELREHPSLADFRDAEKSAQLPEDERLGWARLWKKVAELE